MKKKIITALIAMLIICSIQTKVYANINCLPIVDVSAYESFAINSRGVTAKSGLRTYLGRYMIVTGCHMNTECGDFVDVKMSTGRVLPCVVIDTKGVADSYGNCDITFVVDSDVISADTKRYKTISAEEWFSGEVESIDMYTSDEYCSMNYERNTYNTDVSKRLVIKKKSLVIGGKEFFFIYFADNGNINVKQVSKDKYISTKVDWSVVDV